MLAEQRVISSKRESSIRCGLCHSEVKSKPAIKRLGAKLGIVCSQCAEQFSDQEIELMANMFLAFGGYFNQLRSSNELRQKIISEVATEYRREEQTTAKLKTDVKILHRIFLHGISLGQLAHELT